MYQTWCFEVVSRSVCDLPEAKLQGKEPIEDQTESTASKIRFYVKIILTMENTIFVYAGTTVPNFSDEIIRQGEIEHFTLCVLRLLILLFIGQL